MSVFGESFLGFGERKRSPPRRRSKKKNGNGKNGNGNRRKNLAKDSVMGFEAPGIFEGLAIPKRNGIPKTDSEDIGGGGLPIPELGQDFNTRFGQIGSGFVEKVDPFKIGFGDVLTGNGRTGEIIQGRTGLEGQSFDAFGKRKRGRPKGSGKGKVGRPKGSTKKSSGGLEFDSQDLKKEISSLAKEEGVSKKTARQILKERGGIGTGSVGSMLRESASEGVGSIREKFRGDPIRAEREEGGFGTRSEQLERETDVDTEQTERFRVGLAVEQEVETEKESLLEDEEEDSGMDEDVENGGDDFRFEVKEGEIRRRNGE